MPSLPHPITIKETLGRANEESSRLAFGAVQGFAKYSL